MRFSIFSVITIASTATGQVQYSDYILAPDSRTIYPAAIYQVNGTVDNSKSLIYSPNGSATFHSNSSITIDYEKTIGGVVSVTVDAVSSSDAVIGLTYTESPLWISSESSDGTAFVGIDEVLWLSVGRGPGTYTVDQSHDRGGFRYLTLIGDPSATVDVTSVSVNFTSAPTQDLRDYQGFFHSNDEKLNRVWYAGAYTLQLCSIDPAKGNALAWSLEGNPVTLTDYVPWYSNTTITKGESCLADGAKRDRLVAPGDMTIALPSIFVSTNDLVTVKNSLDSVLDLQNATTGLLPYAGFPFNELGNVSFTYHLDTLIAVADYYKYTGNLTYLQKVWPRFTSGLAWSLRHIDSTGLMNVTSPSDWLRVGMGGHNIEANAILYQTINMGIDLANILNESSFVANWTTYATNLKIAANALLWNATTGLYHDNETTLLSPQDGNAWAVRANLTLNPDQKLNVSRSLQARWGKFGAPSPEGGAGEIAMISPYIGAFELEAHLLASKPQTALDLIRIQWADFMLDDPRMTNSTFVEGYSADGSLRYAPYLFESRLSHSHGWSTGPTSLLSFYIAGIQLVKAQGETWLIEPLVADLTYIHAGFKTGLGAFENEVEAMNGTISTMTFSTPVGTTGTVKLAGVAGSLKAVNGSVVELVDGVAEGVAGGTWTLIE